MVNWLANEIFQKLEPVMPLAATPLCQAGGTNA